MHTVSTALAHDGPSARDELAELRAPLVLLTARLSPPPGDQALLWAGTTLSRLLEPRCLGEGLDDWVLRAALTLLVEACEDRGLDAHTLRAPRRALELLDQLDPDTSPGGRRSRGA